MQKSSLNCQTFPCEKGTLKNQALAGCRCKQKLVVRTVQASTKPLSPPISRDLALCKEELSQKSSTVQSISSKLRRDLATTTKVYTSPIRKRRIPSCRMDILLQLLKLPLPKRRRKSPRYCQHLCLSLHRPWACAMIHHAFWIACLHESCAAQKPCHTFGGCESTSISNNPECNNHDATGM